MMAYNPTTTNYDIIWTDSPSFYRSPTQAPVQYKTRGVTAADFDRDGDQDIYTSTYRLHPNRLWVNNAPANDSDYSSYINAGSYGTFGQGGKAYGVEGRETYFYHGESGEDATSWYGHTIGSSWGDIDNDGYLDLFVGNFRHNSSAWDDVDGDGDLDLVTGDKIFINDASTNGNHWLKIKLDGDGETVNRSAIGSQVRVYIGDEILTRQVEGGTGQGNQNDLTLHFGLGDHNGPVDIEIFWTDGTIQTFSDIAIDQLQFLTMTILPGDANRDGRVDGSDVTILAGNWQRGVGMETPDATWSMGDFNGDGCVDGSDVTILAGNWQSGVNIAANAIAANTIAANAVPEPSMLLLLSILAAVGGFMATARPR